MRDVGIAIAVFAVFIGILLVFNRAPMSSSTAPAASAPKISQKDAPFVDFSQYDPKKKYTAIVKTSVGDITIQLNSDDTPITVGNFVTLARKHFYDNTIFHRVVKDFMIQGGDPTGTGSGGPGYKFKDEPFHGNYTRGTVAMANAGPNTNGSQFFIMHKDLNLPKNYTIFGKVVAGMDIVDLIASSPVSQSEMGELSKPVEPVSIMSIDMKEE